MSLRVDKYELKRYFENLGFTAEVDPTAPVAPWENTAVVLGHWSRKGVKLVVSISFYSAQVVEIERRGSDPGRTVADIIEAAAKRDEEDGINPESTRSIPQRDASTVTDTSGLSTMNELCVLVRKLLQLSDSSQNKTDPQFELDLLTEALNVNKGIIHVSKHGKRSAQQTQEPFRENV